MEQETEAVTGVEEVHTECRSQELGSFKLNGVCPWKDMEGEGCFTLYL